MIRKVRKEDTSAITAIYNHYIAHTTITFELEPVSEEEMWTRIQHISEKYPYFVLQRQGNFYSSLDVRNHFFPSGYCYVHGWKEKAAYNQSAETTIYLAPSHTGKGIGKELMLHLIEECRRYGLHALIACITEGNEASYALHEKLGFEKVSYFREVGRKFGKWLGIVDYELIL